MPTPATLDRRLNSLLCDLADRLAGAGPDQVLIALDDLDGADPRCIEVLGFEGLLSAAEPARAAICDGCGRGCVMAVRWSDGARDTGARAFMVCDKRDDIGRVPAEPSRLRRWRTSSNALASALAALLGTDRLPTPTGSKGCWSLGNIRQGNAAIEVTLAPTAEQAPPDCGLKITLRRSQDGIASRSIDLSRLLLFSNGRLILNRAELKQALGARLGDPRIACEIMFTNGEIILVNHVTGAQRALARPDFDSANDNIFQMLFDNPGQTFTVAELKRVVGKRVLKSLHKVPENLNFTGPLKKLFFRVSADAILFSRTATVGQLATLRIDPKDIS